MPEIKVPLMTPCRDIYNSKVAKLFRISYPSSYLSSLYPPSLYHLANQLFLYKQHTQTHITCKDIYMCRYEYIHMCICLHTETYVHNRGLSKYHQVPYVVVKYQHNIQPKTKIKAKYYCGVNFYNIRINVIFYLKSLFQLYY